MFWKAITSKQVGLDTTIKQNKNIIQLKAVLCLCRYYYLERFDC